MSFSSSAERSASEGEDVFLLHLAIVAKDKTSDNRQAACFTTLLSESTAATGERLWIKITPSRKQGTVSLLIVSTLMTPEKRSYRSLGQPPEQLSCSQVMVKVTQSENERFG